MIFREIKYQRIDAREKECVELVGGIKGKNDKSPNNSIIQKKCLKTILNQMQKLSLKEKFFNTMPKKSLIQAYPQEKENGS